MGLINSNKIVNSTNTRKSLKFFSFDADYFLLTILFLIVIFGSKGLAFEIIAPNEVFVGETTDFFVEVINDSTSTIELKTFFYAPIEVNVYGPEQLLPNSKANVRVNLVNNFNDNRTIDGLFEASFGTKVITKEIKLILSRNNSNNNNQNNNQNNSTNNSNSNNSNQTNSNNNGFESVATGFFSLFSFSLNELAYFTAVDWVAFIVLVVVCAVLIVSFISRVWKRN